MRAYCLSLVALFSIAAHAVSLDDQFDHPIEVPGKAQVIFFAADMDANDLIKDAFGKDKDDTMAKAGVLYVADISKMPGLVFKLFAKSKMQKYPYRMALDKEGDATADWPHEKGAVTIIEGKEHHFCKDVSCLKSALAP
ncbi:MAG: hypothetical protein VX447_04015 [Pseudomonadota bacterium]|uniref:Uncharacterized protein n=1 Tax=Gallaecimonas pentaromativorans TaxID=584787 RepID=A0A3N1PAN3_9GAMM|nr:hypothetical protein [Gallaecimonas pentaromativorans]MED5523907.1 hypothetical protein [Pseudomonadota bacterium]ROQ24838.1 hypothetical protein EDC28_10685 [Gallaecimonas pentaromativorans]